MKKRLLVIVLLTVSVVSLTADIFIREERTINVFTGQPPEKVIMDKWLGENKMAALVINGVIIIDLNANKLFVVDHYAKIYFETNLPVDVSQLIKDPRLRPLFDMAKNAGISISPNGLRKKVGAWNCVGYDAKTTMMGFEMPTTYWASTEVPFDWKKFSGLFEEFKKFQMYCDDHSLKELRKIKGYIVASESNIMGRKISLRVLEISEKEAPPGIYKVPRNFTKVDEIPGKRRI